MPTEPLSRVTMDFLLPTGFLVSMPCDRKSKLSELKSALWREVVKLPAANLLRNAASYVFIGVTEDGIEEQFQDSMEVGDLDLVMPILEVSEPKETRDANILNHAIGEAMGMHVQSLDSIANHEIQSFRRDIQPICRDIALQRKQYNQEQQALYFYPPKLDLNQDLPMYIAHKIEKSGCVMTTKVWVVQEDSKICYTLNKLSPLSTPSQVVMATIRHKYSQRGYSEIELSAFEQKSRELFCLKVGGRNEYMLRECTLHMYSYIRDCLSRDTVPQLQLVHRDDLYLPPDTNHSYSSTAAAPTVMPRSPSIGPTLCTWDVAASAKYCVKVHHAKGTRVYLPNFSMSVKAQLFHGTQPLCRAMQTRNEGWNQPLEFPVPIQCLPRCAKLCFSLCGVAKRNSSSSPLYWVNIQLFNKDNVLQTGKFELGMWPVTRSQEWDMYPQGTPGGNTDLEAPILVFTVTRPGQQALVFPEESVINDRIRSSSFSTRLRKVSFDQGNGKGVRDFQVLDGIQAKDPAAELDRTEKTFLWENRDLIMDLEPDLLPRILQCVDWQDRHQVVQMYTLVDKCSVDRLTLTTGLLLLDTGYPDTRVRNLAVRCLEKHITDELILLYMMQLVQALKFDCYIHSALCRFLLTKALTNWAIGQKFFWNLRADFGDPMSRNWFAPIAEAYCRFCGPVLTFLIEDVKGLNTFITMAKNVKTNSSEEMFREQLKPEEVTANINTLPSLVDQSLVPDTILAEKCRVMSSKMKPLWLDWQTADPLGADTGQERIRLIFKYGDDLRQDMLVIQMLKLTDMILKYANRDHRLTPYECVAMGPDVGLIQVVPNASTVADIQGLGLNNTDLHRWLHENNMDRYESAVSEFTMSCAAYCVATYIFGVSDRHSDNIMVAKDGRVFHIDFGHILNHSKRYYGINRERVPFVLTKDFMTVITKSKKDINTEECQEFIFLCFKAYMTLRRHSSLLITLFKLMMHSNLPELNCRRDLDQLRETLAVEKTEAEAGANFLTKLDDSYNGSWTTKVDWFFHKLNHLS